MILDTVKITVFTRVLVDPMYKSTPMHFVSIIILYLHFYSFLANYF